MAKKHTEVTELLKKQRKYGKRTAVLFVLLLIGLLILWLLHTDIPVLRDTITEGQAALKELFWPRSYEELNEGGYRSWIYNICTWVEDLFFYPLLELVVPLIVPVLFVYSLVRYGWASVELVANTPGWKLSNLLPAFGPQVCGPSLFYRLRAKSRLKALRKKCADPFARDAGIWVTNLPASDGSKTTSNIIYEWKPNNTITIPIGAHVLHFTLQPDGAQIIGHDGTAIKLKPGIPMTVTHRLGTREVIDLTLMWLG